jgi:hypothetical protein
VDDLVLTVPLEKTFSASARAAAAEARKRKPNKAKVAQYIRDFQKEHLAPNHFLAKKMPSGGYRKSWNHWSENL